MRLIVAVGLLLVVVTATVTQIPKNNENEILKAKMNIAGHTSLTNVKHKDCHQWRLAGIRKSGIYVIYPNGTYPVKVHCEHGFNTSEILIQQRMNGQINFYTTWIYYKQGFGHHNGDYWAGLENIHHLTGLGNNRLTIRMQDWLGNSNVEHYNYFMVQSEATSYRMYVSGFKGNLPDSLKYHNGMPFATPDKPDPLNCAMHMRAGWWFNKCAYTLPNGIYYHGGPYTPPGRYYDGIFWKDWLGYGYSLKFFSMTISRKT